MVHKCHLVWLILDTVECISVWNSPGVLMLGNETLSFLSSVEALHLTHNYLRSTSGTSLGSSSTRFRFCL